MKKMKVGKLKVKIFNTRKEMGEEAAKDIESCFKDLFKKKKNLNVVFAAAPSQNDVLKALVENKKIPWNKINAYHMDEYINLKKSASQCFSNFLKAHIFDLVPFKSVNLINSENDTKKEIKRYEDLLKKNPPDLVVLGIGENGHIAFNDPSVADFKDKKIIKSVKLDEVCRQQQVNDGCFKKLSDVPTHALTLTIPTLYKAKHLFCVVPCKTKAKAVFETLNGKIDEHCPASILRRHSHATLYLDKDSSKLLK